MHTVVEQTITWYQLLEWDGVVKRQNYRKTWTGDDFRFKCGKFKGTLLSQCNNEKCLLWCLNEFENTMPKSLQRALIDQYNAQFT